VEGKPPHCPWISNDWPAVALHFGKPWFLPFVGLYYQLQDKLH